MIDRLTRNPLLALAVCVLSGSVAFSQQPQPAPATPDAAPTPAAPGAPVVRRPPMDPRMMQGHMRPGMQEGFHGNMHGGDMHGGGDGMAGGLHIGPGGMWWKNPAVVQRLSLTADQTRKMDDIFQQSRLQLIDLHADLQKQEVLLEPLLSATPFDSAKAMAQIDKVADARASLEKADAKMLLGIRAVLTPDQWTKLRTRGGGPGAQTTPGGPAGTSAPGPGGRGRGMRGGPPPTTSNLVDPVDQP